MSTPMVNFSDLALFPCVASFCVGGAEKVSFRRVDCLGFHCLFSKELNG
jgi:hypothetical protein